MRETLKTDFSKDKEQFPHLAGLFDLMTSANIKFNSLSELEQARHRENQRQSFIRDMTTPCEHGVLDFETCPECLEDAMERISKRNSV